MAVTAAVSQDAPPPRPPRFELVSARPTPPASLGPVEVVAALDALGCTGHSSITVSADFFDDCLRAMRALALNEVSLEEWTEVQARLARAIADRPYLLRPRA